MLAISDIRSQPIDDLVAHLRRLKHPIDLIIYAGDDVLRFREGSKNYFEDLASIARFGLVGVIGNDDGPVARALLSGRGVFEVHSRPVRIGDILIIGVEGAPKGRGIGIGSPLYTEPEINRHLNASCQDHKGPIFIVSHAPPYKVLDQAIRFGMNNIGSRALHVFARSDRRVNLVVCGHCHKQGGKAIQLGRAIVINAASHDGSDDLIRIAHYKWRRGYQLMSGPPDVDFEYARPWGELESITGLWHSDFTKLWKAGITTIHHLADTSAESLGTIVGRKPEHVRHFPILAQAHRCGQPLAIKPFYAPKPRVYFDIETDPHGGNKLCWLIGILDEDTGSFQQYLAKTPEQERNILMAFNKFCETIGNRCLVSYSGSNFDHRNVIVRLEALGLDVPPALLKAVDLLYPVQNAVALPCTGYGLKTVAASLGFKYRQEDLDGFMVAMEYMHLSRARKRIPKRFLEYNEDDVRAVQHVAKRVEEISGYGGWPPPKKKRSLPSDSNE